MSGSAEWGGRPCPPRPARRPAPLVAVLSLLAFTAAACAAGEPWWNAEWPYRVQLECPAGAGDVAYVTAATGGRTTSDGRDLRVVDAGGSLRPFEILHHDPNLQSVIAYQVPPDAATTTWLYYGNLHARPIDTKHPNRQAQQAAWELWRKTDTERSHVAEQRRPLEQRRAELQRQLDDAVKAGQTEAAENLRTQIAELDAELAKIGPVPANPPPTAGGKWQIERGVLLRIYRKAAHLHPENIDRYREMLRQATLEGAGFRPNISDGFNPWGVSDHYFSVYEGYLRIDQPGEYQFCTVSADGSWLYVNGQLVVMWPGAHGYDGAQRGEHHGQIKLRAGTAHIEYYHEAGDAAQLAYVGWQPPGADHFAGIPNEQWLNVRGSAPLNYEARKPPLLAVPDVTVVSTVWAPDSDAAQATLVHCRSLAPAARGAEVQVRWEFGDGLSATGAEVDHVFFKTGLTPITLTVSDNHGHTDRVACVLPIFQVDVVAAYFKFGSAAQYAKLAEKYDVQTLAAPDLAALARFFECLEKWPEQTRAADAFVRRFSDAADAPLLALSAADGFLQPAAYDPRRAAELAELAAGRLADRAGRVRATLLRAEILAWHCDEPNAAEPLFQRVFDETARGGGARPAVIARAAQIGLADVALLRGQYAVAEQRYRAVPPPPNRQIDQAELLAKTGANAYGVEDLLERGQYAYARKAIDQWEQEFPVQKLEGFTFFLRGKVLFVERPSELALRYLDLAERVAPKAIHVPEAVWLRASCLMALKRFDEAAVEFARIRNEFTYSEFYERAAGKMAECQKALTAASQPAERHPTSRPATSRPAVNRAAASRPAAGRSPTSRPAGATTASQPAPNRQPTSRPATSRPAVSRPAASRPTSRPRAEGR